MHHGSELVIVATLCAVLVLGLATRTLSRWTGLPYTVLVLVMGLLLGLLGPEHSPLATGEQVTPSLILFVFLPILVFESSLSLPLHAVRRNLPAVLWLAVPVLLASTAGVAAWMVAVTQAPFATDWAWGWAPALVFGALISATDPVAVVALLRELGAPKRLSVLIEGESLFNDGTAIVLFTLLLGVATGHAEVSVGSTLGRFVLVAGGGVVVGGALGFATSAWLRRMFNQPVVEITLTLALAYAAMVVAESLHVSGVIAVVVAGLWMSGPGRVHVSPEVARFLHRFWEVLASLANTVIFFLVGLVAAEAVEGAGAAEAAIVSAAFVGIVALRAALLLLCRPVLGRLAEPVSTGEAVVMAWGGLRGAVSLALALMIAQEPSLPQALRDQMLLATAGVVLGTLLVNGTTMGTLLRRLGYDRAPAADRLADTEARAAVLSSVATSLSALRGSDDLRTVNWAGVDEELAARRAEVERDREEAEAELARHAEVGREAAAWRQAMHVERRAVWDAFGSGTLTATAVQLVDAELDRQLDALARGEGPTAASQPQLPGWRGALERWLNQPGRTIGRLRFGLIELRYELARARRVGVGAVLDAVARGELRGDVVGDSYRRQRHGVTQLLEDFRVNLPEVTEALETRVARRIALNLEREAVARVEGEGVLSPDSARKARAGIERRMKQLEGLPRAEALPETPQLCREAPLFAGVDEAGIQRIADLTVEKALSADDVLFEQGSRGGNLFIVARGAVAVFVEDGDEPVLVDILGSGDVLGEMELLSGEPRSATVRALTTCVVGEIDRAGFEALMAEVPAVAERVRDAFVWRRFDNHLRGVPAFASLGRQGRLDWFRDGELTTLDDGEALPRAAMAFVAIGCLRGWSSHPAPSLLPAEEHELVSVGRTWVLRLPSVRGGDGASRP